MPGKVKRLDGEPVIIATFIEPFDATRDNRIIFDQIADLRHEIKDRVCYLVVDISSVKQKFSDMVMTLGEARSRNKQQPSTMEMKLAIVGSGAIVEMSAKAMAQEQYGKRKVVMYTSLEDALTAIRANIAN